MELPQNVKEYAAKILDSYSLPELKAASEALSQSYRTAKRTGKSFIQNKTAAAAYMAARMPATYGAVKKALELTFDCYESKKISSVLDIGAGTGAAGIAADELLKSADICFIEREPEMINLGKILTADIPSAQWVAGDTKKAENYTADMVCAAFVLNELSPENRIKAAKSFWNSTSELLIIVESGTPEGFAIIESIKNALVGEGSAFVAAPCTGNSKCPLDNGDWCHFTSRIARSKLHKALKGGDAPYEDEKFSFIALSKTAAKPATGRVLRHPKIESGKITLTLCRVNGIEQRVCRKSEKSAFRVARKAAAGDKFEF